MDINKMRQIQNKCRKKVDSVSRFREETEFYRVRENMSQQQLIEERLNNDSLVAMLGEIAARGGADKAELYLGEEMLMEAMNGTYTPEEIMNAMGYGREK